MQQRYLCGKCDREWVHAEKFDGEHCPAPDCGSADIALVDYDPIFVGADIRTTTADLPQPERVTL